MESYDISKGSLENVLKIQERNNKIGGFGALAILLGGITIAIASTCSAYKSEHVPLTERLEKAYQTCQEIEDKTREIEFAPSVYSSCQEVEDLYFKVKN
ncbi:hypothetical protein HON71_01330 [Candidatus Woesearchaeota archaeon]|jgi:hypothetical protein|nr:hypothetical protein [Candidatus Woesearchaeota archaeon]MBT5342349.1 hypothetical protein [Candidatus Woesearchaeota archaeon]